MNRPSDPNRVQLRLANPEGHRRSSLAIGLILLPSERRRDAFLFYDFCRALDDIADAGDLDPVARRDFLDEWIGALSDERETSRLPSEFAEVIRRHQLDRNLLVEIVQGMKMDLPKDDRLILYNTFSDLEIYCRRVASVVGQISAKIFGVEGAIVDSYADNLGLALQLTNILRDVAEDAAMGRVYLPLEDLERFQVPRDHILSRKNTPGLTHLLNYQAERADSYFAKAELAWSRLGKTQKHRLRPARLMSAIYRDLLLSMHRERYDVFHVTYRVGRFQKLAHFLRILLLSDY